MATPKKLKPRDEMYRMLPASLKVIEESITLEKNAPHQSRVYSAWKVMDKLCPDLKAIEQDVTVKGSLTAKVDLGS